MCGIDGFFGESVVDTTSYYRSHLLLRHRGPDDEGFLAVSGGSIRGFRGDDSDEALGDLPHISTVERAEVLLGHRRLSIIDLTAQAHQPFRDDTGRFALVYNGELFNYLELRAELAALGYEFRTHSDTEVFLLSYIEWGETCFERFNGMWAAALWDRAENKIVLSRDHFGIKPLYYSLAGGTLYFASELKFLTDFVPAPHAVDRDVAADYLYGNRLSHRPETFYRGIFELQPAHCLVYDANSQPHVTGFWDFAPGVDPWNEADAVQRFGELFGDSLRLRMRSDVDVGSLLSGGLDSSLIVCALDALGLVSKEKGFNTFSGVFDDERFSERRYIDRVLEAVPVTAHFASPDASDLDTLLDTLLWHMDEPFRSLSPALQMSIYQQVSEDTDVRVLLNGQGGDELFGGYTDHFYLRFAELVSSGRLVTLARESAQFHKHRAVDYSRIAKRTFSRLRDMRGIDGLFNAATFLEVTRSPLREYLKYDDRTSMAHGLEARPPFLDRRLVEFAFALPSDLKIQGLATKWVEREYAKSIVPTEIVSRTDKMGFVTPQQSWQRGEMMSAFRALSEDLVDVLAVGSADQARSGQTRFRGYIEGANDDWAFAWRVYCLARWLGTL